jgi:hypothetical protein
MGIYQIRLYDLLRKELHLADETAATFVITIEETIKSENEKANQPIISKQNSYEEDIHCLKTDMKSLRTGMSELKINMAGWKAEVQKSIYWAGLAQLIAIIGTVLAIVKFIR